MEYDSSKVKVEPVSPEKVTVQQNMEYSWNNVIDVIAEQTKVNPEPTKLSTSPQGDGSLEKSAMSKSNNLHGEDLSVECEIYRDSSEQDTHSRRNNIRTVDNKCVHDGQEYHNSADGTAQHHTGTGGHTKLYEPLYLSMKQHHSNIECVHGRNECHNIPDFRFQQNTASAKPSVMDLPLDVSMKHTVMHDKLALGNHSDSMETQCDVHYNLENMTSELLPGKRRHASHNEECNSNLNILTELNPHADIPLDLSIKSVAISVKQNKDKCTQSVAIELDNPVCKPRKRKLSSAFCENNLAIEHPITCHLDKNIPPLKLPARYNEDNKAYQMVFQNNSFQVAADPVKKNGCSSTSFNVNKKSKVHDRIRSKDNNSPSSNIKNTNDTAAEIDHVSKNEKQNVHRCDMCKKVFSTRNYLTHHKRTHTGEKPFICDECGKAYTWMSSLKAHQIKHTGEKYACKVCGFSSAWKEYLLRHERLHTGEKPYVCSVCGYAFADSSTLNVHKRIHTGEKPYVCQVCGYASTTLSSLKTHGRIHTGEKPYVCSMCDYVSTQLSNLQRHERTHTGEKPNVCSVCGRAFTTQSSLGRHERIHTR